MFVLYLIQFNLKMIKNFLLLIFLILNVQCYDSYQNRDQYQQNEQNQTMDIKVIRLINCPPDEVNFIR